MAKSGRVAPVGRNGHQRLIAILGNQHDERVPGEWHAPHWRAGLQFGLVNDQVMETIDGG
jgi:hypothetical protein